MTLISKAAFAAVLLSCAAGLAPKSASALVRLHHHAAAPGRAHPRLRGRIAGGEEASRHGRPRRTTAAKEATASADPLRGHRHAALCERVMVRREWVTHCRGGEA